MIIKTTEFLDKLDVLKPGIVQKADMKQLSNVQFTGNEMISYNDQIGIFVPFETDFVASINHTDLKNIISKLDETEFEMEFEDNQLLITTKGTKAGLLTSDTEEVQEKINKIIDQMPNDENDIKWNKLPAGFIQGVELCTPAADKDLSKGTLSCLSAFDSKLLCTDNRRISMYELDSVFESEFLIRAGIAKELVSLNIVDMAVSKSFVHFTTEDNIIFSTKRISGKKLDIYLKVFNSFEGEAMDLPDGFSEIVNAAAAMTGNEDTKDMHVYTEEGNLICESANERGWVEKNVSASGKEKLDIQISSKYVKEVIDIPGIKMTVGENSSLFVSGNFKHVIQHKGGS